MNCSSFYQQIKKSSYYKIVTGIQNYLLFWPILRRIEIELSMSKAKQRIKSTEVLCSHEILLGCSFYLNVTFHNVGIYRPKFNHAQIYHRFYSSCPFSRFLHWKVNVVFNFMKFPFLVVGRNESGFSDEYQPDFDVLCIVQRLYWF